jgi:signal transduction histidine kinase/DNA-binding NarL/FixJ family response regulator
VTAREAGDYPPGRMSEPQVEQTNRLTRMALGFWVVGIALNLGLGRPWASAACGVPIAGLLVVRALWPAGGQLALLLSLSSNVTGLFAIAALTGGTEAPALVFLPTFAVAAGLLASRRQAVSWLIAGALGIGALRAAESFGLTALYPPTPYELALNLMLATLTALLVGSRAQGSILSLASVSAQRAEAAERLAESLAEARARAEQLVERRAAFLANVSHELRTPLGAVVGLTRVLDDQVGSAEQREILETLRTSADSLRMLVDDLLDHEAMDRGMLKVEQGIVTPRALVSEVCALFAASASAKGLQLRWDVGPEVPRHVRGDALRLRQVLSNLVSNAVKYTSDGSIEVRARTDGSGQDVQLVLDVIDTGPGMDAAARALLFLPFERTGSDVAKRTTGTGLGLALARRLAEAMGGTLEVDSVPGRGSTFRLRLPCVAESVADEPVTSTSLTPLAPAVALDVLVVDDEPVNRRVACLLLERMGHRAADARTAHQALEAARARPFDVILLDYHMPDHTGPELARELLATLAAPSPVLVGLTASVSEDTRRLCLEAGMQFVLSKPIDVDQLRMVLDRVAHRRRPARFVPSADTREASADAREASDDTRAASPVQPPP